MSAPAAAALSKERPFPGLRPFGFDDHAFFFGRDEQKYALYRLIDHSRFLAVVGSSGSGKSSLVRAGLLPLLEEETADAGGRIWARAEMRPGSEPIAGLANALAHLSNDPDELVAAARSERIAFDLRRSSFGILEALKRIDGIEGKSIILLVDQFEELFRYAGSAATPERRAQEEVRTRDEAAQFVQLLLQASRNPAHDFHVLITMRSDFIGDCARFQGLPEAVSANQFLVPSLARDQREDIIRRPLEEAGASIESVLVERLLNDSSEEMDQLPVLQHCLLRLWERAGQDLKTETDRAASPPEPGASQPPSPPVRHLTIAHYQDVGRMSGALSQHADEILNSPALAELQLAVEQAFRALSEIDRDGRAIRRALRFSQLLAETGVSEADLRTVVDRFRASDCSFLVVSSVTSAQEVGAEATVDVVHEALLRRWERASGDPGATGERNDQRRIGWLRDEERDGRRYQSLLSMVESESAAADTTLPFQEVDRRWKWWNERPRTPAWAARYGGGFESVEKLLKNSRARKQSAVWAYRAAGFAASVGVIVTIYLGYTFYEQRQYSLAQAHVAEENFKLALTSAQQLSTQILSSLNKGTISITGAWELLNTADEIGRQVSTASRTPETTAMRVNLSLTGSDIYVLLGNVPQALGLAQSAKAAAQQFAAKDPNGIFWQQLVYEGGFRIADIIGDQGNHDAALTEYLEDQAIVQQIVARAPENPKLQLDLAFISNKVGETLQVKRDYVGARKQFDAALVIAETLVRKDATNVEWQLKVAATRAKIGNLLVVQTPRDLDGALEQYDAALKIEKELARAVPDNDVVVSNLALDTRRKADVLALRGDTAQAAATYQDAIARNKRLVDKDPGVSLWLVYLAADHLNYGNLLKKTGDLSGALAQYRLEFAVRQMLASRDPNNNEWKKSLEASRKRVADLQPAASGPPNEVAGAGAEPR